MSGIALEQTCKRPGHWHIEGWCAIKGRLWVATDGGCQDSERELDGAKRIYASTLNGMRDRVRDVIVLAGGQ